MDNKKLREDVGWAVFQVTVLMGCSPENCFNENGAGIDWLLEDRTRLRRFYERTKGFFPKDFDIEEAMNA